MQDAQRLPGRRRRQVYQVPEPPHVLELQVLRVIEVNVRLRGAIHQQRPGPGPVTVSDKLGEARIDALPDDGLVTAMLPVGHNHHCVAVSGCLAGPASGAQG